MAPRQAEIPPDQAIWRFAGELYARPGVEDACLALQDQAGQDVMALLFLCWAGASGAGRLDEAAHAAVAAVGAGWSGTVTGGLRRVRRALSDAAMAGPVPPAGARVRLRRRLLALELQAERQTAALLQAAVPLVADRARDRAARLADAAANLVAGCRHGAGRAAGDPERTHLATLLAACFPEATAAQVRAALSEAGGGG